MAECEVPEIVKNLLASYASAGGINHIDSSNLPSKGAVGLICEDLLRLLFPGFLDEKAVSSADLSLVTTHRVASIIPRLQLEVARSLRFGDRNQKDDYFPEARVLVCQFLKDLGQVRALLKSDVKAAYEGDPAAISFEEIILSYPSVVAIAIQRMAHLFYQTGLPLLPRMMTEWAHSQTGIDIHPGAQIGGHFFIDHGTGVVIGETCVIGSRVKLYHGVTLGARSFAKEEDGKLVKGNKRHPNVEDDVVIYPGATILGGETTLGARSTIGANSFLMTSIPPDSLVNLDGVAHRVSSKLDYKKQLSQSPEDN